MKGSRVEVKTKDREPEGEERSHRYYSSRKVDRSPTPHTRSGSHKRPHQSRRDEEPQPKCRRDKESTFKLQSKFGLNKSMKSDRSKKSTKSKSSHSDGFQLAEVKSSKSSQSKKKGSKELEQSKELAVELK